MIEQRNTKKQKMKENKKYPYKKGGKNRAKKISLIVFTLFLSLFLISQVSAFLSVGHYTNYNNTQNEITIGKHSFLLFGQGTQQVNYTLLENQVSVINGYAIGTATLYQDGVLFSGKKFKGGNVKDSQIFIEVNESYQVNIPEYKQVCKLDSNSTNNSQICNQIKTGSHNETRYKTYWKKYNGEKLSAGTYKWKLTGKRNINQKVDWILTSGIGNIDLNQWAWWNNSWNYKREISNLTGEISYLNISYDSDMQSNFDDLRFVNNAENTELNYTIEDKIDNSWAIIRVNNLGETSIYMYYENVVVSTTSDVNKVYFNPQSIYYLDENSGTLAKDETGNYNGTYENSISVGQTGYINKAPDFDGVDDDIDISSVPFTSGQAMSIFMWVKPDTLTSSTGFIRFLDQEGRLELQYDTSNNEIELRVASGSGTGTLQSGISLNTGVWSYIGLTSDGSNNWHLYKDGSEIGTSINEYYEKYSSTTRIGKRVGTTNYDMFDGKIDEIIIYNRQLSNSEIQAISNQTVPNYVLGAEQTQALSISITYPTNTTYSENVSTISYNYTNTPDYCWYSRDNGTTNSSLFAGGVNITNAYSVSGSNTWWLYCNDTYGNNATDSVTFTLNKLWNNSGYPQLDKEFRINEFINVSGKNFTLAGEQYKLQGVDSYYLFDYATDHTYDDSGNEINNSRDAVNEILSEAHNLGVNVIRTWANAEGSAGSDWVINESGGHYNLFVYGNPSNYSNNTLEALDWLISQASKKDIRLQLVLVNNWDDYGGMRWYVMQSPTTNKTYEWINDTNDPNYWVFHDQFYTDSNCKQYYKDYVNMLLNRNNTITGVLYKNDPTIFAWLLANEPRAKSDADRSQGLIVNWTKEMTSYVKSIDSNHLVGLGIEGFGDPWEGTNFIDDHNNTGVDFATFELHPDQWDWFAQRGENATDLAWQTGGVNSTSTIDWWTNTTNNSWNNRYETSYVPNYDPALARHNYDNWVKQNVEWANSLGLPVLLQEVAMPSSSNDSIKDKFYQQAIHTFFSNGGDGFLYWNLNHDNYYYSTTPAGIMDDGYSFYVSTDPVLKAKSQSVIDAFNFTKHDNNGGSWVRELNNYGYDFITNVGFANDINLLNSTLFLNISDGTTWRNEQSINTSKINANQDNIINKQFNNNDTKFYWYITVYASDGTSITSPLTYERIRPDITSTSFTGTYNFLYEDKNMTLNFTATDNLLSTCWYYYNNTNTTIPCSSGVNEVYYFPYEAGQNSLIIYANNTYGLIGSKKISWNYNLIDYYETYNKNVMESSPITISGKFQTNNSLSSAYLEYNNENYSTSINSLESNKYILSVTLITPEIELDKNITFFFWVNNMNSTKHNQTVLNVDLDNCSNYSNVLYNFTIVDEKLQTKLSSTTSKIDMQIYPSGETNLLSQFNKSYTSNPFSVCININSSSFKNSNIYALIEYSAQNHQKEFYNIQNDTMTNSSLNQNITLRDLNSSNAQQFKLIIKDTSYLPLEDALVEVYRKYVDEGAYKIVEIPKTDANGETTASLVINDVIYKFVIKKYGKIIGTFPDVRAYCQNPSLYTCQIPFNTFQTGIDVPNYTKSNDFLYTLGYNSSSRLITSDFSIPSGSSSSVTLNITTEDALQTSVCTDSIISTSGTLSCAVPDTFGNSTIRATLYKNGIEVAYGNKKLDQNPADIYGGALIFLGIFVFLTLIGIGVSSDPKYTIFFILLGVIFLSAMNLIANNGYIGKGATILWMIITLILVLIKGGGRKT